MKAINSKFQLAFGLTVFLLELLDSTSSVNQFLFTRKERMALVTDVDSLVTNCAVDLKGIPTGTMNCTHFVIWMYTLFHLFILPNANPLKLF